MVWFWMVFFDSLRDGDINTGPRGVKVPENEIRGVLEVGQESTEEVITDHGT